MTLHATHAPAFDDTCADCWRRVKADNVTLPPPDWSLVDTLTERADPLHVEEPLGHGFSPRPSWAGTCIDCGAKAGTDCAVMGWIRDEPDHTRRNAVLLVLAWLAIAAIAAWAVSRG
jgi:hypothetical protein